MASIKSSGYCPGDSILHTAGPGKKILLALIFVFITGTADGSALLFMIFLCHLGMLISGMFILDAWKRLAMFKIFFLVLGVTPLFLTPGVPLYFFSKLPLPVTMEGIECSFFTLARLACMIWVSMILVRTTPPKSFMDIVHAGSKSRFFANSKILQDFLSVGMLSFQILPHLLAEAEEKMRNCWQEGKEKKKINRLETLKQMVRYILMWVIELLDDPERLMSRIEKV